MKKIQLELEVNDGANPEQIKKLMSIIGNNFYDEFKVMTGECILLKRQTDILTEEPEVKEIKKERWFFTFGYNSNKFVCVEGNATETRTKMHDVYGTHWAFQYSEEDFDGQIEIYGLQEIPFGTQPEY